MIRTTLRRPLRAASLCAALCAGLAACAGESADPGSGADPTSTVSSTSTAGERSAPTPRPLAGEGTGDTGNGATAGGAARPATGRPATLDGVDLSSVVLPGSQAGESPRAAKGTAPVPLVDSKLVVSGEDTARFGTVKEGDEETHVFDLAIEGDEPVNVFDERSTCGCTVGRLELVAPDGTVSDYAKGTDIPADHELRVHGTLTTEGKRGPQSHSITLRHNGSNRATLLHFEAEVLPTFEVSPNAYFNFGEFFVNEERSGEVEVSSPVVERFALELDTTFGLPDYLSVELEPADLGDDGRASRWSVKSTIGPNAPEGLAGQQGLTIILKSDIEMVGAPPLQNGEPRTRSLNLFVYARVKSLVHARPSYVSFGAIFGGADARRQFTIEFADGDYDIERMRNVRFVARDPEDQAFYDDFFESSVEPSEDGKGVVVNVWFDDWPAGRVGPFGGDVVVEVGHPTRPELRVPFSGVCRDLSR